MNKFSLLAAVAGLAACAAAQSFTLSGSLLVPRANAAAVLLANGNVLVAGGETLGANGEEPLAESEIYSPGSGTFTATGSLATARIGAQAVLLSNGKVLVVGGNPAPFTPATTAELYDPAAGTFSPAPALPVQLDNPVALALPDGRVFITGPVLGCNGNSGACTSPVVLYNPLDNTFAAAGQLQVTRSQFAAAVLASGNVLIVAGWDANAPNASGPIGSAEVYDPATATSQLTGSLAPPVPAADQQTAALLGDGTVLVCGGGAHGFSALPYCETYDPVAGQFSPTGTMNASRVEDAATQLNDGTVLMTGGLGGGMGQQAQTLGSAELYTPNLRSFSLTGSLTTARSNFAAVRLGSNAVLVAGGYDAHANVLASAELYQPAAAAPADFSVTASTGQIDLTNQTSAQFGLTANSVNGFSGTVALACTDVGGATCSFDPATLTAGQSGTLTVANLGAVNANVLSFNLSASSGTTTHTLPLRITFSPTAAPASLTFSATTVGGSAAAQSVTLTSAASGVKFASVAVSGDFSLAGNTCWQGLEDGADCSLPVSFTPTASGTRTGTLTATDAAGDPPLEVSLTGTGIAPTPTLAIDPDALSFPNQLLNSSSPSQTVTFTNSGAGALSISAVTITGDFAQTNTCGSSLAAGKTCTVAVVFTPTASGNRSGTLGIADNATGSPQQVSLTGLGTTPAPVLQTAPNVLAFSSQLVTTPSAPQTITLTNSGTAALALSAIAATGDFAQTNTCGSSLAAGKTCTVAVIFTPTASGSRTGSLNLADNAPGSPQQLALTGTGADLSLATASGSSPSTSVAAGQTATFSLAVQGMGGFTGAVALACTGAPATASCSVNPGALNATSAATPVTVSVATVASSDAPPIPSSYPAPPLWLVPLLGLFAFLLTVKPRLRLRTAAFAGLAGLGLLLAGCGGSMTPAQSMTQPGTAAGSYTLTLTATSGSLTRTMPLSLQVH